VTADVTATHATPKQLTQKMGEHGRKLYMYNLPLSHDLYNDLEKKIRGSRT
jgi:hypothetical protein